MLCMFLASCTDTSSSKIATNNTSSPDPIKIEPTKKTTISGIIISLPKKTNSNKPLIEHKYKEICGRKKTIRMLGNNIAMQRSCTKDEKDMIYGINKIISLIKNFDPESLKTDFVRISEGINPSVMIFGEDHLATIGKIQTLGAINSLAKKGDILLLEGSPRNDEIKNCALSLVFQIYSRWQYKKSLLSLNDYHPDSANKFSSLKMADIFDSTINSYDLSGLNIKEIKCFLWDLSQDKNTPFLLTRKGEKERNLSMVESIKDWNKEGRLVFINTGLRHMPLGEMMVSSIGTFDISDSAASKNFYDEVKKFKNKQFKEKGIDYSEWLDGASKVLWRYLQTIPHVQYIHKRMFIDPYDDF